MRTLTEGSRPSLRHLLLPLTLCFVALSACQSTPQTAPDPNTALASKDPDAALNEVFAKMPVQGLIKVRVKPEGVFVDDEQVLIFETPYKVSGKDRENSYKHALIQPLYDAVCELNPSIEEGEGEVFKCKPRESVIMLDGDAPHGLLVALNASLESANALNHRLVVRGNDGLLEIFKVEGPRVSFPIEEDTNLLSDFSAKGISVYFERDLVQVHKCSLNGAETCDPFAKRSGYELGALYKTLSAIKQGHPTKDKINFSAPDDYPVSLLARFARVVRFQRVGADGHSQGQTTRSAGFIDVPSPYDDACRTSVDEPGDAPLCLFPKIMLSFNG